MSEGPGTGSPAHSTQAPAPQRSGLGMLFSRLQNLLAITVWPQSSGNTLDVSDDDAGLFLLFPVPTSTTLPTIAFTHCVHGHNRPAVVW